MPELKTCPRCGAKLSGDGPGGSCPACLLALAITPPGDDPSIEEPALNAPPPGPPLRKIRYFGDYELLEEIARGGMGVVYRARQLSLNRPVALKMITAGQLATRASIQRFHTEAEAAARLDHPNIVPIYEIGQYEAQHYFSMKLIAGGTLADLSLKAKVQSPKSPECAARLVGTVARAVHYGHQRGILHRDLKPTNILLDEQGGPHVTDFGLAKLVEDDSSLTVSATMLGTPAYMAPEQAAGRARQLTTAADIYSLGAILYELLTGQVPFRAETAVETLRQVCEAEPPPPRSLNPKLDRDLETICLKCLSKDPQKRYGSADMLAQDLEHWRNGEPIVARPVGAAEKAWHWCRRRPVTAGLLAALLFVFAVGLVGILWEWRQARRNADVATDKLIEAYIAQARATRRTGSVGRRYESLAAVSNAATLNPTSAQREQLRNEAIAAFALTDLRVAKQWPVVHPWREQADEVTASWRSDPHLRLYAQIEHGEVTIRQVADDREISRLPGVGSDPKGLYPFSRDGRFLGVVYADKTNRLWEIANGKMVAAIPSSASWAFSPDNRFLAVSNPEGSLSIQDVDSWKESRRVSLHSYTVIEFFSDANRIAGVPESDDRVEIVNLATGKILDTFMTPDPVSALAISTDGHSLAAGGDQGRVYIWNIATGERLDIDAHQGEVGRLAFNHAATLLASASSASWTSADGTFRLWDPATGRLLLSGPGDDYPIQFSDDDRFLAYGDVRNVSLVAVTPHPALRLLGRAHRELGSWPPPAFSPDGRLLATVSGDDIQLWDLAAGKKLAVVPEYGDALFHPDGTSLITSSFRGGFYRWPIQRDDSATNLVRVGPRTLVSADGHYGPFGLSRDGRFLAMLQSNDTAVLVFHLANPSNSILLGPISNAVDSVAISPDGRFVATGVAQRAVVQVWDVARRQVLAELPMPPSPIVKVGFSSDGRWLAASGGYDPVYRLYRTGSWVSRIQLTGSQDQLAVPELDAFSPDGEIWAIGNPPFHTRLYSTATGRPLAILEPPHQMPIASLAFSPDGATLAVMQNDSVVQLWDLRQIRQQLAALNLDWDLPPYSAVRPFETRPVHAEIAETPAAAQRRNFLARTIPPRPADAPGRLIDLSNYYNAALTESWHEKIGRNDLSELSPGVRELAGTLFDVRGLIQLGNTTPDELEYPWRIPRIHVNQLCARLHFLHSAIFAGQTPSGTRIGAYAIHYVNGRFDVFNIEVGNTVLDWWSQPQDAVTNAVVAWIGENEKSRKTTQKIRLFKTTWNNPFPSVPIARIEFLAAYVQAKPFLVAITAE
jgi:WD40 repeat protein/tRNA A-37 threonylcarbamoyl transferase component Bud32